MKAKKKSYDSKIQLDNIITNLQSIIDQIYSNFGEAKALILELARMLDEEGHCEQGHVCREIKKFLKDKISEGKITEKWIEECLPREYKRRYSKSELSSLSKQDGAVKEQSDQQLIKVDNTGEEVMEDDEGGEDTSEIQGRNESKFGDETKSQDTTRDDNTRGYTVLNETSELKIHKSELVFMIHQEKYQEVSDAMKKSTEFIEIIFDQLGPFIRAEPDV